MDILCGGDSTTILLDQPLEFGVELVFIRSQDRPGGTRIRFTPHWGDWNGMTATAAIEDL